MKQDRGQLRELFFKVEFGLIFYLVYRRIYIKRKESWLDHVPHINVPSPVIEPLDRIVGSPNTDDQLKSFDEYFSSSALCKQRKMVKYSDRRINNIILGIMLNEHYVIY